MDKFELSKIDFLKKLLEKNWSKKIISSYTKKIIIENIIIKVWKTILKFERFFLSKKKCKIFKKNAKKLSF